MERGVIVWVGVCHGLCLSARYRAVGNAPSGLRLALDELTLRACSNASSAAEGGLLRARANRVMALALEDLLSSRSRYLVSLTGYPRGGAPFE